MDCTIDVATDQARVVGGDHVEFELAVHPVGVGGVGGTSRMMFAPVSGKQRDPRAHR